MPTTVTCPECDETYQVSDEWAQQQIRCRRCQCPIEPARAVGIQSRPDLQPRRRDADDGPEHARPPLHHPSPRSPFPVAALLTIIIGILFFLLAFSVGFNIWFLTRDPNRFPR